MTEKKNSEQEKIVNFKGFKIYLEEATKLKEFEEFTHITFISIDRELPEYWELWGDRVFKFSVEDYHVKEIIAQNCGLTTLPELLKDLKFLEALNLSRNRLHRLPKFFPKLNLLKKLVIRSNPLNKVPQEILKCTSLEYLDLTENNLDEIPASIDELGSLKTLKIWDHTFKILPKSLTNIKTLETLSIGAAKYLDLTILSEIIPQLKSIKKI